MEEFHIIQPLPVLAPFVKNYWLLKTASDFAVARTVPTGMLSLIFHRGHKLLSVNENVRHPRAFLNGQEHSFTDLQYNGQVDMISVVFLPVGVRAFFNLPINKLTGLRLTAGDLEDKELSALENSISSSEETDVCILLIEQFLIRRLMRLAQHNLKRIETTIRLINSGETNVTTLADAACLGRKQFNRIFSEYVGAHPKEFSRTIRFQRALYKLETNPQISWAALAADCGYFDQSHMIREFYSFSGYTPSEYLTVCPPHSDYFN